MYSASIKNNRGPSTLFFHLLVIAGINVMVILRANNVTIKNRRKHLGALGTELTKEYVQRRATMVSLPRKLKKNIRERLNINAENAAGNEMSSSSSTGGGSSCKICPAKIRRQSKTQCNLM
ncbi:hypothetical protein EVAR_98725_1 [Eumeta japonica]|uniref:Uncharacterized protein n=1 Tax=Eumeta variegata TaxID=151549 RepID=A0A4C1ZLJ5_EUMVA|nr:hypothetical protein EVAR_98725_1 [Eumeta japonica]